MKTGRERFQDTLSYLQFKGLGQLANDIRAAATGRLHGIGEELSLGTHFFRTQASIDRRRALRALLLCQRVFWCRRPGYLLPLDWKSISLRHWDSRQEPEIVEGIRMYTITSRNPDDLARAAENVGTPTNPDPLAMLTVTRQTRPFPGGDICFQAVRTWLVQSGLKSLVWYLKHLDARADRAKLTEVFGRGHPRWPVNNLEFRPQHSAVPAIRRGFIVHFFAVPPELRQVAVARPVAGVRVAQPAAVVRRVPALPNWVGDRWVGHWAVSVGGGLAYGSNNNIGDPPAVMPQFGRVSIDGQFAMFKKRQADGTYERGCVEEIDPTGIPERH